MADASIIESPWIDQSMGMHHFEGDSFVLWEEESFDELNVHPVHAQFNRSWDIHQWLLTEHSLDVHGKRYASWVTRHKADTKAVELARRLAPGDSWVDVNMLMALEGDSHDEFDAQPADMQLNRSWDIHLQSLLGQSLDPHGEEDVRATQRGNASLEAVQRHYRQRLNVLVAEGKQESISLNPESTIDLFRFIKTIGFTKHASLVLMDNGDIRAVWQDESGGHLALRFLGRGQVQFVIIKHRTKRHEASRVTGTDGFEVIKKQVRLYGLATLVSG